MPRRLPVQSRSATTTATAREIVEGLSMAEQPLGLEMMVAEVREGRVEGALEVRAGHGSRGQRAVHGHIFKRSNNATLVAIFAIC